MTNKNDGGAAFPQSGYERWAPEGGMTLRDYFAAKALQGICAHPDTWGMQTPLIIAKECYTLADAMLEARNK